MKKFLILALVGVAFIGVIPQKADAFFFDIFGIRSRIRLERERFRNDQLRFQNQLLLQDNFVLENRLIDEQIRVQNRLRARNRLGLSVGEVRRLRIRQEQLRRERIRLNSRFGVRQNFGRRGFLFPRAPQSMQLRSTTVNGRSAVRSFGTFGFGGATHTNQFLLLNSHFQNGFVFGNVVVPVASASFANPVIVAPQAAAPVVFQQPTVLSVVPAFQQVQFQNVHGVHGVQNVNDVHNFGNVQQNQVQRHGQGQQFTAGGLNGCH